MRVVLISGKAESGKDFIGNRMLDTIKSRGQTGLILHFADLVKYVCKQYYGWNGEKDEVGRSLLQRVGTDMRLTKDPSIWADMTYRLADFLGDDKDFVIIPDLRFFIEVKYGKLLFEDNITTVRINRWEDFESTIAYQNHLTEEQRLHASESELDNYEFDYYIDNCPNSEYNNLIRIDKIINDILNGEQYD